MTDPNQYQNMNKYQVYRKIRSDRAYRTLGKMNAFRVIAGALLLLLVFLIAGSVSKYFAARGSFKAAEFFMIAPGWVEKNRPELKSFIEAGTLYQAGDYQGAYDGFDAIDGFAAAVSMREACLVRLAQAAFDAGKFDEAYEHIAELDGSLLPEKELEEYCELCTALSEYYLSSARPGDAERGELMKAASDAATQGD